MKRLTEELVRKYCVSILDNIGVSDNEEERCFGFYIYAVSKMFSGYGLEICRARYVDIDEIDKKTVFATENQTFCHGDWEELLYELFLKAPGLAAARKAREDEERRKKEEWEAIYDFLVKCPDYLPLGEASYSIALCNSGVFTREYVDSIVKVVQTKSGDSWSGHYTTVKIYVPEIIKTRHWYGTTEETRDKLVFDGYKKESFIDGYWRQHLIELVEAEKARREKASSPSVEKLLEQIRDL